MASERQLTGIGLVAVSLIPLAYALGFFDRFLNPPPPTGGGPNSLVAGVGEQLCADPLAGRTYNQGRVRVLLPSGLAAVNMPVYGACGTQGGPPSVTSFQPLGVTDGNGVGPYLQCGFNVRVYFYAADPTGTYQPSGIVGVC